MTEFGRPSAESSETILDFPFDVIVVLGAFMQKDNVTGEWKMPTIIEEDPGKVVGGHSRAIATRQLFNENQAPIFLVTGGMQKDDENPPVSRAEILAGLMKKKYKIPQENVKAITTIGNTLGNIDSVVDYFRDHSEIIKKKKIGILSNRWHLDRAKLMFDDADFFQAEGIGLEYIAVEDVLKRRSKHYEKWEATLEGSDEMKQRRRMEEKGIDAYLKKEYKPLNN